MWSSLENVRTTTGIKTWPEHHSFMKKLKLKLKKKNCEDEIYMLVVSLISMLKIRYLSIFSFFLFNLNITHAFCVPRQCHVEKMLLKLFAKANADSVTKAEAKCKRQMAEANTEANSIHLTARLF